MVIHTHITDLNHCEIQFKGLSYVPCSEFKNVIRAILNALGCPDIASRIIHVSPSTLRNSTSSPIPPPPTSLNPFLQPLLLSSRHPTFVIVHCTHTRNYFRLRHTCLPQNYNDSPRPPSTAHLCTHSSNLLKGQALPPSHEGKIIRTLH